MLMFIGAQPMKPKAQPIMGSDFHGRAHNEKPLSKSETEK
jgi:hypothetical protein